MLESVVAVFPRFDMIVLCKILSRQCGTWLTKETNLEHTTECNLLAPLFACLLSELGIMEEE